MAAVVGARTRTLTSLRRFGEYGHVIGQAAVGRVRRSVLRVAAGHRALGVVVESENGIFVVDVEDQVVGRRLAAGSYATDEIDRISTFLTDESRVLVLGGHIGSVAIPLATIARHVEVVEANPDTFRLLELNVRLAGAQNVTLHPVAVNDSGGTIDFLANRANSGGSKRAPQRSSLLYTADAPRRIRVPAARGDDLFPDARFDVILVDIEGSEYFALRGMPELLARAGTLFVEFVPHHLSNVAGVGVVEWLDAVMAGGFTHLTIPSMKTTVPVDRAAEALAEMFESGESDDGLIFSRVTDGGDHHVR